MKLYELFYRYVGQDEVYTTRFRASDYDNAVTYANEWIKGTEAFLGKSIQFISVYLV